MPNLNNVIEIKEVDYNLIVAAYPNSAQISTGVTLTYDPNSLYLVTDSSQGKDFTLLDIYPVGAIYLTLNDVNPNTLFGGTWEQIKDRFLLASGDTYQPGTTGGSNEYTFQLDVNNLPEHRHAYILSTDSKSISVGEQSIPSISLSGGGHDHSFSGSGTLSIGGSHSHSMSHNMSRFHARYGVNGAHGGSNTRYLWEGEPDTGQKGTAYFNSSGVLEPRADEDIPKTHTSYNTSHDHSIGPNNGTTNSTNSSHAHDFSITTASKSVEVGGQTYSLYTGWNEPPIVPSGHREYGEYIHIPTIPPYLRVKVWKRIS